MKVSQFVVLEYAPLAGLMKRSREGGGGTTEKESKMIINYEYQRRSWMERGFVGQGHALYECGHYEQALEWCEKGLNFLARKKRQLPQKERNLSSIVDDGESSFCGNALMANQPHFGLITCLAHKLNSFCTLNGR